MHLAKVGEELLAGFEQKVKFTLYAGSYYVKEGTELTFKCSRGLKGRQVEDKEGEMTSEFVARLPAASPFETVTLEFEVMAELPLVPNSILVKESRDQAWIHQEVEHRVSSSI